MGHRIWFLVVIYSYCLLRLNIVIADVNAPAPIIDMIRTIGSASSVLGAVALVVLLVVSALGVTWLVAGTVLVSVLAGVLGVPESTGSEEIQ